MRMTALPGSGRITPKGGHGKRDPIKPVGRAMAHEARLLCFDEFSITDIADAMILGRLFTVLFQHGTVIVATSNVAPDDLYRDGLNRQLFLPFIDMLKAHCDVFELDARTDYRLEKIGRGEAYLSPLGEKADATMQRLWGRLTEGEAPRQAVLTVKGRSFSPGRRPGLAPGSPSTSFAATHAAQATILPSSRNSTPSSSKACR